MTEWPDDSLELWCDHAAAVLTGGHAIYCTTCGGCALITHVTGAPCNDVGRPNSLRLGHGVIECPACGSRASLDEEDPRPRRHSGR